MLGDHAVLLGLRVDHPQDPGLLPERVPPSGEKLHYILLSSVHESSLIYMAVLHMLYCKIFCISYCFSPIVIGLYKRVLNDIWRTKISRGRMIWLLAHPHSPSPISKLDQRHTGRLRKRKTCWRERVGRGWMRSRIIRPQESLVFYKAFSTLWVCTVYIICDRFFTNIELDDILFTWYLYYI